MLRSFGFPLIPVNALVVTGLAATLVSGCSKKQEAAPPMATPSVTLSRDKVPLGGPIDIA